MMSGWKLTAITILTGLSIACGDDDPVAPVVLQTCPAAVQLTVGPGTSPEISWTPACLLFFVIVEPADAGNDLWSVISRGENVIAPPVRYGVVPAGAQGLFEPPVELIAGQAYKVAVGRWTGPGDEEGEIIGVREFTP
jgi:hypothetical protein